MAVTKEQTQSIDVANDLMRWLVDHYSARNWRTILKGTRGGVHAIEQVEGALADVGRTAVAAIVPTGTGTLKAEYSGPDGEALQTSIAMLKSNGRLLQLGQGRGYALVLLDDTPLGNERANGSATPQTRANGSATPQTRESKRAPRAEANPVLERLKVLTSAIQGLEAQVEEIRKLVAR